MFYTSGMNKVCPQCKSKKVKRIIYGTLEAGSLAELDEDDVIGGSVISDDDKVFHCVDCEFRF